ncbi:MAG: primosomal protein N' [Clostridia bacterium]|nr:primosomal protein N' [Clostridia bacterium]
MHLPDIVKVAVEGTAFHFDKEYSYLWPESFGEPQRGLRVLVPFGGGNRRRQAVVLGKQTAPEVAKLKPVASVLDEAPLFTEEMLDLAVWLKERTFCPLYDALRVMLPPGLTLRVRPTYRCADVPEEVVAALPEEERTLFSALSRHPDGMERSALLKELALTEDSALPEQMLRRGLLSASAEAFRQAGDATVRMVRLVMEGDELEAAKAACKLSEKQMRVVELLEEVGCASIKEIGYFAAVTAAVVQALHKKGLVEYYEQEILRSPVKDEPLPELVSTPLNAEQQRAFDGLSALLKADKPSAALLYGVTGSGKTQVYMNLIDETLSAGKQALVLVPEISLTPQLLALFVGRYGRRVAVLHSGLSVGERMDEWKRIRRGDVGIVVGTRSAVFAPLDRLGLVVFDEEQEHTYKSETTPRYHARDVAKFRCARQGALLLLASATPSIETYHHALSGRYSLFSLTSRYGAAKLPTVTVADMRADTSGRAVGDELLAAMRACLDAGRQAILLLNRRGYNTFVSCRSCGHVITCPSCSISMTYHRANAQLMCHYCGHMCDPVTVCPNCGSDKVRYAGLGTQRVEQELTELFPDVPILRMDTDTTMSRFAYERKFGAFARGEYRIMIGTQMVAKGLDFPDVGLVGVLSADQALYGDDYRCYETSFALLTQVIGRAGRRDGDSLAVIQTYTPDNYVIELAAKQDYPAFYETEIEMRRRMKYPPYTDLCQFGFVGVRESATREAALRFLQALRQTVTERFPDVPVIALDPTPATVSRVSGKYRYKLLIKTAGSARARQMIAEVLTAFGKQTENKDVTVFADINPASMM